MELAQHRRAAVLEAVDQRDPPQHRVAQVNPVPSGRLAVEEVIKGGRLHDVQRRPIQRGCDLWQMLIGDVAAQVLNIPQYVDQPRSVVSVAPQYGLDVRVHPAPGRGCGSGAGRVIGEPVEPVHRSCRSHRLQ